MRNPGGYAVWTEPESVTERDTYRCSHCGFQQHVKPRQDPAEIGGLCKQCMGLICPRCVGKGCLPLEKKLEQEEARYHALRSYGLWPGDNP